MAKRSLPRILSLGVLIIIFWVAVWDIIEILIDKYLKYIGKKDSDKHKLIIRVTLAVTSLVFMYVLGGMDLVG